MDRDDVIRRGHAEGRTLQQIGDELGVTGERVRQLAQALGLRFQTPTRRALGKIETARALVASGVSVSRAARVAGLADRTLRQAGLRSLPRPVVHNLTRYRRGCRCEICTAANRDSVRARRGKEPPRHGTQSAYWNYGCRCEPCKAAGAAANRAQAAKRRGRGSGSEEWSEAMIETIDEIIEELADSIGVYGVHEVEHPDGQCECRLCFSIGLKDRIDRAVRVDAVLTGFAEIERRIAALEAER